MPEITSCPECERKLRIADDLFGKTVRCPGCNTQFTATSSPVEEEPPRHAARPSRDRVRPDRPSPARRHRDDEDDRPRRRSRYDEDDDAYDDYEDRPRRRRRQEEEYDEPPRRGEADGWRKVRLGLTLTTAGSWIVLGTFAGTAVGLVLLFSLGVSLASLTGVQRVNAVGLANLGTGLNVGVWTLRLAWVAGTGLQLVGLGLCMAIPEGRRASGRPLGIAAFACMAGWVTLTLLSMVPYLYLTLLQQGGAGIVQSLGLAVFALWSAGAVLWFLFLRQMCRQVGDADAGGAVMANLIAWLVYWPVGIFGLVVSTCAGGLVALGTNRGTPNGAQAVGWMVLVMGVGYLTLAVIGMGLYAWYVFVLGRVRGAVDDRLARL